MEVFVKAFLSVENKQEIHHLNLNLSHSLDKTFTFFIKY